MLKPALFVAALLAAATVVAPRVLPGIAGASPPEGPKELSVVLLDLESDGLVLADEHYPVGFDADGDGAAELWTWPAAEQLDALLWLDLSGDRSLDHGELLVGTAGASAASRLESLDQEASGGDGDGEISKSDGAWLRLGAWVDRDHDGVPEPDELSTVDSLGIRALALDWRPSSRVDGSLHRFRAEGRCTQQTPDGGVAERPMAEIWLRRVDDRTQG